MFGRHGSRPYVGKTYSVGTVPDPTHFFREFILRRAGHCARLVAAVGDPTFLLGGTKAGGR
ncbi:MAG: hypothetical protein A2W09_04065 [Deltaproteobacteria bacterium RBG_16_50_11]|nr:MAG: hypothetical protein A2W09_04065 [Deltaproteobacteria bacterium RBG_16_50_11]